MLPSADDHSIPSLRKCTLALDTLSELLAIYSDSPHVNWSVFCELVRSCCIAFELCPASHFDCLRYLLGYVLRAFLIFSDTF